MMMLADVSAAGALLTTVWWLFCAATAIVFLAGLTLAMPVPTRKTGQRVLFFATALVAIDIGLLILALTFDS